MTQFPDNLLYSRLVTLFPTAQVGVGPLVYHAEGDPIPPYVTYTRTSSTWERDLAGNPMVELVEYDVAISSMFFNQVQVDMTAFDNFLATDGNGKQWYFNIDNQTITDDQFSITFSFTACAAIG